MTTLPTHSQCAACRNFQGDRDGSGFRCEAFSFIPPAVITNETDHRRPIEGDDGVQFEAKDGEHHPFDRE